MTFARFTEVIDPTLPLEIIGGIIATYGLFLYFSRKSKKSNENETESVPLESRDLKTLKTEDLEREFGNLTIKTKTLDEDENLFFKQPSQKKVEIEEDIEEEFPEIKDSIKLVDEAYFLDSFGKQEQAIECLKKAIEVENNYKEKVRLKILLNQYINKRKDTSLNELIKEYPSFHKKVSYGEDNTLSSLMGAVIPKSDSQLNQNSNQTISKDFDIFADLPILEDTISSDSNSLVEEKQEPLSQHSLNNDIFADVPVLHEKIEPTKEVTHEEKVDQFSWNNSTSTAEDDTEKMLKTLQKESEEIDRINENEAIDDMQKFWKEFGNMVSDIKNEVVENHNASKNEPINTPTSHEQTVIPAPTVLTTEEEAPKTFRVWANWIINIDGQQVFKNHFVTLKNAWGTSKAGEELYMGITKLSGKSPSGKPYTWVLVSVFPLQK